MIPEGYEKLAVVGIAWKGDYAADTAYKTMNAVYHEGSTYVALRDNPTGPPTDDNSNWQYLAKGFVAALLSMVTAKDTSGLMGTAGDDVGAQALMDAIANKVATELVSNSALAQKLASYVAKVDIVQTESTRPDVVPSSAYLKQQLDTQNSNLGNFEGRFNFLSADSVQFDAVNNNAYFKTVKDNIIFQLGAEMNGMSYGKIDQSGWHLVWNVVLFNLQGFDAFYDPNYNACLIKWRIRDDLQYQLVVDGSIIGLDRWDGARWTRLWTK